MNKDKFESSLFELVKNYNSNTLWKTYGKYRNQKCTIIYDRFFTKTAIVTKSFTNNLFHTQKTDVMQKLCYNCFDKSREFFEQVRSAKDILKPEEILSYCFLIIMTLNCKFSFWQKLYQKWVITTVHININIRPDFNHVSIFIQNRGRTDDINGSSTFIKERMQWKSGCISHNSSNFMQKHFQL